MSTNLSLAFKHLRKKGYFARMNFQCCQSCGWAAVAEQQADKAVFYHAQDHESFKEGEDLFLAWSGNAYEIIGILHRRGLICEWNGRKDSRILIKNKSVKKA
jgi:hypothetical protein